MQSQVKNQPADLWVLHVSLMDTGNHNSSTRSFFLDGLSLALQQVLLSTFRTVTNFLSNPIMMVLEMISQDFTYIYKKFIVKTGMLVSTYAREVY